MWTIVPPAGAARALAVAAYLAAVLAFLLLQEIGLRLRDEEQRAWWAGTGRDLLNVAGLVAISGALRLLGLRWPAALLVGGTLTLAMFGASVFVATQLETAHRRLWAFALGLAFALPAIVFLDRVVAAFALVAGALFPGEVAPRNPG
ncbi:MULTISPECIES: hypothetical protein [Anaeromyxobacter]|uniref:hypothetical protein n=1 Tax=Anaeromyxobacter TaxID=161492 RepID=UPI001F591B93|nr:MULTISPECIES: hypothetical protein [unclassified Anaeromyxobacter]